MAGSEGRWTMGWPCHRNQKTQEQAVKLEILSGQNQSQQVVENTGEVSESGQNNPNLGHSASGEDAVLPLTLPGAHGNVLSLR